MTREELKNLLYNMKAIADYKEEDPFVGIYFSDLLDLLEDYKKEPSLPSDVDEAAKVYSNQLQNHAIWLEGISIPEEVDDIRYIIKAFKAGAEWMAEQGKENSFEATVCKAGETYLKEMDRDDIVNALKEFSDGDKVIVQIRKK